MNDRLQKSEIQQLNHTQWEVFLKVNPHRCVKFPQCFKTMLYIRHHTILMQPKLLTFIICGCTFSKDLSLRHRTMLLHPKLLMYLVCCRTFSGEASSITLSLSSAQTFPDSSKSFFQLNMVRVRVKDFNYFHVLAEVETCLIVLVYLDV